ncbi:uncharacterized protein [Dermacentor albipictus]|uniref:uncharacterized protein isoform X2 n=1 Tax=Dermacentor albipictus TaxID=60249 RepID=UPI0031FC02B2
MKTAKKGVPGRHEESLCSTPSEASHCWEHRKSGAPSCRHRSDSRLCSQVYCASCTADAPARALLQNSVQFNGYHGCSWCLHPGKSVDGTIKYPADNIPKERTHDLTLQQMAEAASYGTSISGIKGPSPLINLRHFDIIWGFTPDYMHCVLLGVTRQLTDLWLTDVNEPYYIGAPQVLNSSLQSLKPPLCFVRLQRSLALRKYWKATEWQQWLLYFALPCLQGILPSEYRIHFSLFVKGICLLLKDCVSSRDVTESTHCLARFVVDTQFLYSKKQMTFNMHQIMHLPKSVVLQGPLWAHSCFAFETNLGKLKELVTSAKGVSLQIVERLLMSNSSKKLKALATIKTQKFMSKTKKASCKNAVPQLGKPRELHEPLLGFVKSKLGDIISDPIVEHDRVEVCGYVFHSKQYSRPHKTDSTALMAFSGFL